MGGGILAIRTIKRRLPGSFPNVFSEKGIALITVVSVMGIGLIMGLSYLFGMRFEDLSARNFLMSVKSRYCAESGVNYASVILENDGNLGFDSYSDNWRVLFAGDDIDNDLDGKKDSAWIDLGDGFRCAVLVEDDSGKACLNAPWLNLQRVVNRLVSEKEITKGVFSISGILAFLRGDDNAWGVYTKDDNSNRYFVEHNHVDDDLDGEVDESGEGIDEPYEFCAYSPAGDDNAIIGVDEIRRFGSIKPNDYKSLVRFFSADSVAQGLTVDGRPKLNINYVPLETLLQELMKAGISNAWQLAVNIRDFLDRDFVRSRLFSDVIQLSLYRPKQLGDWDFANSGVSCSGHCPNEAVWEWQGIPTGNYYCYFYGDKEYVGDIKINNLEAQAVKPGAKLDGILIVSSDKTLSLSVSVPEDSDYTSAGFSSVKLSPVSSGEGAITVSGVEGIRITEVYPEPSVFLPVSSAQIVKQGAWLQSGNSFVNSSAGSKSDGAGEWKWSGIENGSYYVQVVGRDGERVGDVTCSWSNKTRHMIDRQWMSGATYVSNGEVSVKVENNEPEGTSCYFSGIIMSQEPDVEFIEIVNITDEPVDLSGWYFIVPDNPAWPAFIPQGTVIGPRKALVFCADPFDSANSVSGNRISLSRAFQNVGVDKFVQLDFAIDLRPGLDVIPTDGQIELRDSNGNVVDGVDLGAPGAFLSLARAPLENGDEDNNGNFDAWPEGGAPSPGEADIEDIDFANGPVFDPLSLSGIPFDSAGLSKSVLAMLSDTFSFNGIDLYPLGSVVSGWRDYEWGAFSDSQMESGAFKWENLPDFNGMYYHIALEMLPGEGVTASVYNGSLWEKYSDTLWADASGIVDLGWVLLDGNEFRIKLNNASPSNQCHLYGVHISPNYKRQGVVNLNTAPLPVLFALPISESSVKLIDSARPFSAEIGQGMGKISGLDIPSEDMALVFRLGALNSSCFRIISTGGVEKSGRVKSKRRVVASVVRGE